MQSISTRELANIRAQLAQLEQQVVLLRHTLDRALEKADPFGKYNSHFPLGVIYHIAPAEYYEALPADADYVPETFKREGFIHCTRGADLLAMIANRRYRAVPGDFLMLVIDPGRVVPPIKYEALDQAVPYPFPHIYGPLNRDAIVDVMSMPRAANGMFLVPPFTLPDGA